VTRIIEMMFGNVYSKVQVCIITGRVYDMMLISIDWNSWNQT